MVASNASHSPAVVARFWSKVEVGKGDTKCWEWRGARSSDGYGSFKVRGRAIGAHRVAYELFYGQQAGEPHFCHDCDNPGCCNPRHIFVGTHADNMADKAAKGRGATSPRRGAQNPAARLSEDDVRKIKALLGHGFTNTAIGAIFGVTHSQISAIKHGKAWAHVQWSAP